MAEERTNLKLNEISQLLFETAAEGLIVSNERGKIVLANPSTESMFGYTREELIGLQIEELIPKKHRKSHSKHREGYNKQPSKRSMGIGMDLSAVRKDGSEFPVEISLNHFEVEGEKLVMALITDITERKRVEVELQMLNFELEKRVEERTEALQESQQLYSTIARNFPNGTINVFDQNLDYIFVEGQELFKLGITSEKLVGTNYLERISPEIREDIKEQLLQVFEGNNTSFEVKFRDNHYRINAVALYNNDGTIGQILVVEQNITQQKKAEENMRLALEKEQQLNELKSRFVSMASHEFRTPLSTILSSVSLINKYKNTEEQPKREKHINRIKSSVHNLTGILNDFLSLDKLEEGKVTSQPEEIDIQKMIKELVGELQEVAKKGQKIIYNHQGKANVYLDKQMLKNILINLVSNAIKYSHEEKQIEVKTAINKSNLEIEVKDHGIGIPKEEHNHLFERFFRAKNSVNIEGTGLGLNIVKKYVELMKGDINFESEEMKGTTFQVTLPQKLSA